MSAAYLSVTPRTARHFSGRKEPADGAVCAVENVHVPVHPQAGRGQTDNRRADFGGIEGRLGDRLHQFAVLVEFAVHPLLAIRIVTGDRGFQRAAFDTDQRSEEHTSELQSLMRISYAVF